MAVDRVAAERHPLTPVLIHDSLSSGMDASVPNASARTVRQRQQHRWLVALVDNPRKYDRVEAARAAPLKSH